LGPCFVVFLAHRFETENSADFLTKSLSFAQKRAARARKVQSNVPLISVMDQPSDDHEEPCPQLEPSDNDPAIDENSGFQIEPILQAFMRNTNQLPVQPPVDLGVLQAFHLIIAMSILNPTHALSAPDLQQGTPAIDEQ
jgi:hypothetical protein